MVRSDWEVSIELSVVAENASDLRAALLDWWEEHGRHWIPWKLRADGSQPEPGESLCALSTWIAEVMLQQTQLQVVLPYWQRWMRAFPTLEALAGAEQEQVLLLWQGLGYYSRARRLHQGARQLLEQGSMGADPWPRSFEAWLALPGIGRSTAGSILSSAFDLPFAILDGNVKRVLARLIASPRPPARELAGLWWLSEKLLDPQRPRAFNQALMDLGATVCTPRNPACGSCPWRGHCAAYAAGTPAEYPVKDAPRALPFQVIGVGVVFNDRGQVLIDLIGAGALVGLGLFQLTPAVAMGEENWAMQLMAKLPELDSMPLLGLGAGCALVSPENLVFYVKEGGMLLTNHTSLRGDLEVGAVFVAVTASLLLLPPLLWIVNGEGLRVSLERVNDWLVHRAEWLVGVFALVLGLYLGWQGLEGLYQLTVLASA